MQGGLVVDCGLRGNAGPRCIDRQEVADPLSFGKVGRQSQPRDGSRDDPLDRLAVAIRAILCEPILVNKKGVYVGASVGLAIFRTISCASRELTTPVYGLLRRDLLRNRLLTDDVLWSLASMDVRSRDPGDEDTLIGYPF